MTKQSNKKEDSTPVKSRYSFSSVISSLKYLFNNSTINNSGGIIRWGEDNMLPEKLFAFYLNDALLSTICNGLAEYVFADGIEYSDELKNHIINNMAVDYKERNPDNELAVNSDGEDLGDIIKQIIMDYIVIGTYTNDIYFSHNRNIAEIYYLDVVNCRLLTDRETINYSKNGWINGSGKKVGIPLFDTNSKVKARSIFMHYNKHCRTVYPLPRYYASLDDIEIDQDITLFHKNGLRNGFSQFKILWYPGVKSEEEQDEIEKNFKASFAGPCVAGGTMLAFDDGTGIRPELIGVPEDNFDDKYTALHQTTTDRIYMAFRAHPILFGIMDRTTGFSEQEYFEVLKLFLNMVVEPIRRTIIEDYSYIFGVKNAFSFKPSVLEQQLNQNKTNDVSEQ